ncbi:conjugative transposon protein TraM [Spirosoma luteum]|uniref:conjugative transposon protein TraM n=1 Tax=Spirosoma luteum TaxID=431553 RepID=UPI000361425F|nr:conjugative transposon protein TraM [Spirosoma luteum]
MSNNEATTSLDGSRIKQLFQDKRFVTFLTGAGICLILIIYYFVHHTKTNEEDAVKTNVSLNADIPNAGDSTGLPSRSKLELAAEGHPIAMPNQMPMERGINSTVPGLIRPEQPHPAEADSYIYGGAVPDEIYEEPDPSSLPVSGKRSRKPSSVRSDLASEDYIDENSSTSKQELEKQKKLLVLLQAYKVDKLKRQEEVQGRALKPETVPVSAISSLNGPTGRNSFYGLQSDMRNQQINEREDSLSVTVKAMIFSEQTIVSGGRVSLRLLENITIRGRMIPEGTRLYGLANFGGQRVNIAINQVQYEGRIIPMKLTVYDMDGLVGIYVPTVLAVEQGRLAASQAASGFNVSPPVYSNNVPTLAAASALQVGIQGGRSFFSRKVGAQKATLKNNYYVLLK